MKLKTTFRTLVGEDIFANLILKKAALAILLICCVFSISKAQSHDDSTVVLEKNAFAVTVNKTPDGLLKFELVNNQASEITPFFIETYLKGYVMNTGNVEQSMNNVTFTENIEHVYGPQFMGLGVSALPAFGNYKTTLTLGDRTNEPTTIQIRISGTQNGQPVIWFGNYNF